MKCDYCEAEATWIMASETKPKIRRMCAEHFVFDTATDK